jgi:hypothetical protein
MYHVLKCVLLALFTTLYLKISESRESTAGLYVLSLSGGMKKRRVGGQPLPNNTCASSA